MQLSDEQNNQIDALCRAVPITRMVDYGMKRETAAFVHRTVREGKPWDLVLEELARAEQANAETADDPAQARECWHAAAANLIFAQMAFNADGDRKRDLYRQMTRCFARFASLSDAAVTKFEVPHKDGKLFGWQFRPGAQPAHQSVIVFGGMSGWSTAYRSMAEALCERDVECFLVDGPGQGESRLEGGIYADAEVTTGFSTFIDLVLARTASQRIGLWGNSYGGLLAALTAVRDPRVVACCINGAPLRTDVPPFRTAQEQLAAMFGTEDLNALAGALSLLTFDGRHLPLSCATLVLEGGADMLVKPGSQRAFLEGNAHPGSRLKTWPDGEHTIYNHPAERNAFVAEWFRSML